MITQELDGDGSQDRVSGPRGFWNAQIMLAEAFAAHSSQSDFKGSGYGYGWYVGKLRDAEHVWHYGSTCGFSTRIERFPGKKLSVIVLANRRDTPISPIVEKIIELFW